MSSDNFLPRKQDAAFRRLAFPEAAKMLLMANNPEYVYFWDDFLGTRTGTWPAGTPYASTLGTGTQVIGLTAAVGGTMTVTTDGSDLDSAGQGLGLNWRGDDGIYFITRYNINDITTVKYEIGLTDSVTDNGAVLTKAIPEFTAGDCALFIRDTNENTTTAFVSNDSRRLLPDARQALIGGADADSSLADVNTTFVIAEILVQGDKTTGYVNGVKVGTGNINGASALTPWAYCLTRTGTLRTLTLDYWGVMSGRELLNI